MNFDKIKNLFTQHPHSLNESYGSHFMAAFSMSCKLFYAGFCCMLHSVMPFLFQHTASDLIKKMYDTLNKRQGPN